MATEQSEDFEPILPGKGASDYERYLRTDELLSLQPDPETSSHRDKLLFTTVHQSSELWLKLAWNEVEEAGRLVGDGDLPAANRLLRRASDCLKLVTSALDMLEHMSPWEYTEVRKVLGHGSGFDSPGFKEIRRVAKPLGEAFHAARERAGLTLVEVYTRGREFDDLYTLAEQLIEPEHEVPISFRLTTARSALDSRKTYSVSARIIADGRLAWISDAHHPVTLDSSNDLELVLIPVPEGDQPR